MTYPALTAIGQLLWLLHPRLRLQTLEGIREINDEGNLIRETVVSELLQDPAGSQYRNRTLKNTRASRQTHCLRRNLRKLLNSIDLRWRRSSCQSSSSSPVCK